MVGVPSSQVVQYWADLQYQRVLVLALCLAIIMITLVITTTTTVLRPYRTSCVSWHSQL